MNEYDAMLLGFSGDLLQSSLNQRFAEQSASKQYARQLQFWELQAEYNKPINQRMRLEQAGLNPNMMYSNGGINNVGPSAPQVPGNEYAQKGVFQMQMLNSMMQMKTMQADINLKNAEAENLRAGIPNHASTRNMQASQTFLNGVLSSLYSTDQQHKALQVVSAFLDNQFKLDTYGFNFMKVLKDLGIQDSIIYANYAKAYKDFYTGQGEERKRAYEWLYRKNGIPTPMDILTAPGILGTGLTLNRATDSISNVVEGFKKWISERKKKFGNNKPNKIPHSYKIPKKIDEYNWYLE